MRGTESPNRMRDVWCWALSWFSKPPACKDKRARQAVLVDRYLAVLRGDQTIEALHERYAGDPVWSIVVAREVEPATWSTLGVHACLAAAYGIRYVELLTGHRIDPDWMPRWITEWAIW